MYPSFAPEDFPEVFKASQKALESASRAVTRASDSQASRVSPTSLLSWQISHDRFCMPYMQVFIAQDWHVRHKSLSLE